MLSDERICEINCGGLAEDCPDFSYGGCALLIEFRELLKAQEAETLKEVQRYIDENNIYRVEFGHYDGINWIPLKTIKVDIGKLYGKY